MESFNTYDNISNQLLSLESDLDSEYKKCLITTESFGSKIVNFIKNLFNFFKKILINIWKSLVSVLKILFNKIRDLFSSLFSSYIRKIIKLRISQICPFMRVFYRFLPVIFHTITSLFTIYYACFWFLCYLY